MPPHSLVNTQHAPRTLPLIRTRVAVHPITAVRRLRDVGPTILAITLTIPPGGVDPTNVTACVGVGAAFVGIGGAVIDEARDDTGDRAAITAAACRMRPRPA